MKLNKNLLDIKTAISLVKFYVEQGRISEFEGNFILKQLKRAKQEMEGEIVYSFEKVFTNTMIELGIEDWWALADSGDFEIVEETCAELENYDSELFEMWKTEMMEDI